MLDVIKRLAALGHFLDAVRLTMHYFRKLAIILNYSQLPEPLTCIVFGNKILEHNKGFKSRENCSCFYPVVNLNICPYFYRGMKGRLEQVFHRAKSLSTLKPIIRDKTGPAFLIKQTRFG